MNEGKEVILVSLKYHIGHIPLINAYAFMLSMLNYKVYFYLADSYLDHKKEFIAQAEYVSEIERFNPRLVIIMNLSIHDANVIKSIKKNKNAKVLFVYHEPWNGYKRLVFSPKDANSIFKQVGRRLFARKVIMNCDAILLPSWNAYEVYHNYEYRYNKKSYMFPLVFVDDVQIINYGKREFFSFIGVARRDKGIKEFFDFIAFSYDKDPDICYLIATPSDLAQYMNRTVTKLVSEGRIKIKQGSELSKEEMYQAFENSMCVWLAYNESSQSGVLPYAFMHGCPCIATPVGVFREKIRGNNGRIVKCSSNYNAIYDAYKKIKQDRDRYIRGSRESFEDNYSIDKNIELFKDILYEVCSGNME